VGSGTVQAKVVRRRLSARSEAAQSFDLLKLCGSSREEATPMIRGATLLLRGCGCDETYLSYWLQVSLSIFRLVTFMSAYSLPAASSFSFGAIFASAAFDL